jgi:hypothetical protein
VDEAIARMYASLVRLSQSPPAFVRDALVLEPFGRQVPSCPAGEERTSGEQVAPLDQPRPQVLLKLDQALGDAHRFVARDFLDLTHLFDREEAVGAQHLDGAVGEPPQLCILVAAGSRESLEDGSDALVDAGASALAPTPSESARWLLLRTGRVRRRPRPEARRSTRTASGPLSLCSATRTPDR